MDNSSLCGNSSSDASIAYALCLDEAEEDPSWSICPDLTLCNSSRSDGNVGFAFGLTIGAGLATTLGALLPFVPCIKRANTRFLSVGLAVAAGVMLYVSFTEIWKKSRDNFCCVTQVHFEVAVTVCFFGGIILTILLDLLVTGLQKLECRYFGCCCCPSSFRGRSFLNVCCLRFRGNAEVHKSQIQATNTSLRLENTSTNGVAHSNENITTFSSLASIEGDTTTPTGIIIATGSTSQGSSLTNGAPLLSREAPPLLMTGKTETDSMAADGTSISANSATPSVNTNNYAAASVNELFSTSSLLRMNTVVELEEGEVCGGGEEDDGGKVGGEECGKLGGDSASQLGIGMEGDGNGFVRHHKTASLSKEPESDADSSEAALGPEEFKEVTEVLGKSTKKLKRMGLLTGKEPQGQVGHTGAVLGQ